MSDNTTPFGSETWWALFEHLEGSPWEGDDIADADVWREDGKPSVVPAAEAMKYAYDRAKEWEGPIDPETAVIAVLTATSEFHSNEWTPIDAKEMADHFAVYYKNFDDPMQDRLDENYDRMPLEWLGDHGRRELEDEICKGSEIWINEEFPGVWVFNKPGRTP